MRFADDGCEAAVGDWLDIDPRFGSLRGGSQAIRSAGKVPGVTRQVLSSRA